MEKLHRRRNISIEQFTFGMNAIDTRNLQNKYTGERVCASSSTVMFFFCFCTVDLAWILDTQMRMCECGEGKFFICTVHSFNKMKFIEESKIWLENRITFVLDLIQGQFQICFLSKQTSKLICWYFYRSNAENGNLTIAQLYVVFFFFFFSTCRSQPEQIVALSGRLVFSHFQIGHFYWVYFNLFESQCGHIPKLKRPL